MSITALPDPSEGVRVLVVTGELDAVAAPDLLEQLPQHLVGSHALVLDLSEVTFFDSAGCRVVDGVARSCAAGPVAFRLVAPPGSPSRRVLELTGMAHGLAEDDRSAALAAVTTR